MTYQAPIDDIQHILTNIIEIDELTNEGLLGDLDQELLASILSEAGKFASNVLDPLNKLGDQQKSKLEDGHVTTPEGWKEAYEQWVQAGWGALPSPAAYGGQDLPHLLAQPIGELWNSANMSFGLCPLLTQGAVDAIEHHASDELKATYLENMVTGTWTGTMNLTEPGAGSDLSAISTKATKADDGTYRIKGTKIFITYGEHDLSENIIHLVLARLPDAPEGTKGISLFIVPKFLVNEDGSLGERNDLICAGLEHKLGIHASPTCVMSFGEKGGAVGYLVGEENRGLFAMFTMMNLARLSVGTQGVAISERAYQQALSYSNERQQGQQPGGKKGKMTAIINHPDIRRTLAIMKAKVMASRAICLMTAKHIDISLRSDNSEQKKAANQMAALLTPIAKALPTDLGLEVTSSAIQVHGGMGFIEETGVAQYYRDARILPIYEGTNGIQAIDLVTRKLPLEDGETLNILLNELDEINNELLGHNEFAPLFGDSLKNSLDDMKETLTWLKEQSSNTDTLLYSASNLLRLMGLTIGGAYLIKGVLRSKTNGSTSPANEAAIAQVFARQLMCETASLKTTIISGSPELAEQTNHILQEA